MTSTLDRTTAPRGLKVRVLHEERTGTRPFSVKAMLRIPRVKAFDVSPDGQRITVEVHEFDPGESAGRRRLWLVPTGGSGEAQPLTRASKNSTSPVFSPDGARLLFLRKGAHDEEQVRLLDLRHGRSAELTRLPLGVEEARWLPDGSGVVVLAKLYHGYQSAKATSEEKRLRKGDAARVHITDKQVYRWMDKWLTSGEVAHVFHVDLASRRLRRVTEDHTDVEAVSAATSLVVSPRGDEVLFTGMYSDDERDLRRTGIFAVPLEGGPVRILGAQRRPSDTHPRYVGEGREILYARRADETFTGDRNRLWTFDRSERVHRARLATWDASPEEGEFAPDGSYWFTAERDGRQSLFRWGLGEDPPEEMVRGGRITHPRPAGDGRVYFLLETLSDPAEVHSCDAGGRDVRRETEFTRESMDGVELGRVEEWRFRGARDERVQMLVVFPPGAPRAPGGSLVQVLHGGPHAISGDEFQYREHAHVLAADGHVVALPNFHGSSSWGDEFARSILGAWGVLPLEDLHAATDLLEETGVADPRRVGVMGASYGGYLVSWATGHTDRFRCAVMHAGEFDCWTQYAGDGVQDRGTAMGGEPWTDPGALDRNSPSHFVGSMDTPTLVLHGGRDYRVPPAQGLMCYAMLRRKGVPTRLAYFEDASHHVIVPAESVVWYREVLAWLREWLDRPNGRRRRPSSARGDRFAAPLEPTRSHHHAARRQRDGEERRAAQRARTARRAP